MPVDDQARVAGPVGAVRGDRRIALGKRLALEQQQHARAGAVGDSAGPARHRGEAERLAVEALDRIGLSAASW